LKLSIAAVLAPLLSIVIFFGTYHPSIWGDRVPVGSQTCQRRGIGRAKARHLRRRRSPPLNSEVSERIAFFRVPFLRRGRRLDFRRTFHRKPPNRARCS